jgi:hypothetical protein
MRVMGEPQVLGKSALIGSLIEAVAGIGWTEWGAAGLTGPVAMVIRIVGIVVGLVLAVRAVRVRRGLAADPGSAQPQMFASRGYRLIVAAEAVAIIVGVLILGLTHHSEYNICWISLVVGVHFFGFGKLFATRFYYVGAALLVAAVAGAIVGFAGGGVVGVPAVTGLASGLVLLVASAVILVQFQAQRAKLAA